MLLLAQITPLADLSRVLLAFFSIHFIITLQQKTKIEQNAINSSHVLQFHVMHFHALQFGPSFSCPSFSAPPMISHVKLTICRCYRNLYYLQDAADRFLSFRVFLSSAILKHCFMSNVIVGLYRVYWLWKVAVSAIGRSANIFEGRQNSNSWDPLKLIRG